MIPQTVKNPEESARGAHEARAQWDGASPRAVRETGEAEVQ